MKHSSFPNKGPKRKYVQTYSYMPPANQPTEPMSKEESKPVTVSEMVEQLTKLGFVVLCPEDYTSNQDLESQLSKAKELLTYASQRMTKAREILTERDGQPDCWQMLNSDKIESFLKS